MKYPLQILFECTQGRIPSANKEIIIEFAPNPQPEEVAAETSDALNTEDGSFNCSSRQRGIIHFDGDAAEFFGLSHFDNTPCSKDDKQSDNS